MTIEAPIGKLLILAALLTATLSACGDRPYSANSPLPVAVSDSQQVMTLDNRSLSEASGLTRSSKRGDLVWMHNDSGDTARLFAVGTNGQHLGVLTINGGESAIDWEDIASFSQNGKDYLLIADVGDNNALRPSITLYIIEEPDTLALDIPFSISVKPAWRINATYPDGARDCEAVAVDQIREEIILLSKRDRPPRLYSLPLSKSSGLVTASFVGAVSSIPAPTANDLGEPYGKNRNRPTGLDISPDGSRIGVLTYKDSYLFTKEGNASWLDTLNSHPKIIDIPQLKQAEAGGFSITGNSWIVGSEKLPAVLVKTNLQNPLTLLRD
jgi:hypothetical protein